jgi:hypothetical protein
MACQFFTIPLCAAEAALAELNGFLRSHRILMVDHRLVDQGGSSFWAFCVDYLESSGSAAPVSRDGLARNKVDYRERLSPEDFAASSSSWNEPPAPVKSMSRPCSNGPHPWWRLPAPQEDAMPVKRRIGLAPIQIDFVV